MRCTINDVKFMRHPSTRLHAGSTLGSASGIGRNPDAVRLQPEVNEHEVNDVYLRGRLFRQPRGSQRPQRLNQQGPEHDLRPKVGGSTETPVAIPQSELQPQQATCAHAKRMEPILVVLWQAWIVVQWTNP